MIGRLLTTLIVAACAGQVIAQDSTPEGVYVLESQQVTVYFTINFDGDNAGIIVFGNDEENDAFWDAYVGAVSSQTVSGSLTAGDGRPQLTLVFDGSGRATITYTGDCASVSPESVSCTDDDDPFIQSPGVIVKIL